jgi:aminopeptidase YwaD
MRVQTSEPRSSRLELPGRSVALPSSSPRCASPRVQDTFEARNPLKDLAALGVSTPPPPALADRITVTKAASPNAAINDNSKVESTLEVTDELKLDALKLDLDIGHTYRGDLRVSLTSPSGKTVVVHDRAGGSTDDLKGPFDLSTAFAGEAGKGTWKLTVEDTARADVGTLKNWGITLGGTKDAPQPPPRDDSDPMKHLEFLASAELQGRDTPSPGLDAASRYVENFLKAQRLKGPNVNDVQSPFQQTFDVLGFAGARAHDEHGEAGAAAAETNFGNELFDQGFYLDESLSDEDLNLLGQRYLESRPEGSEVGLKAPTTLEDLRQVAQLQGKAQNTMGLLEGTGPHKDEVIVVMGHLDHIGAGPGGINFGADDNASGSAAMLSMVPELVKAQKEGKLDRSVLFLWTAAEEKGLVGAKYFVDHPIPGLGLDKIQGVINMDMVGRWDDQRLSVIDSTNSSSNYFKGLVEQANGEMADPFDRINHDINQYRDRQDGAIFSRKGEDVLFLFEGLSNPNGGGSLNPDYHRPTDTIDKIIRDNGGEKLRRVRDLMINVVQKASNRTVATSAQPETVMWG